jgi:hypothetical protein
MACCPITRFWPLPTNTLIVPSLWLTMLVPTTAFSFSTRAPRWSRRSLGGCDGFCSAVTILVFRLAICCA